MPGESGVRQMHSGTQPVTACPCCGWTPRTRDRLWLLAMVTHRALAWQDQGLPLLFSVDLALEEVLQASATLAQEEGRA